MLAKEYGIYQNLTKLTPDVVLSLSIVGVHFQSIIKNKIHHKNQEDAARKNNKNIGVAAALNVSAPQEGKVIAGARV